MVFVPSSEYGTFLGVNNMKNSSDLSQWGALAVKVVGKEGSGDFSLSSIPFIKSECSD